MTEPTREAKKLYARMRTLLNEALPPHLNDDPAFSRPQKIRSLRRIFSKNAVLSPNEPDLTEVGVDGTVAARPGASADSAPSAPGRGMATFPAEAEQLNESPAL